MNKKLAYTSVVVSFSLLSGCAQINKAFDNVGSSNYSDSESVKSMEVPPDLTAPEYDSTFVVNAPNTSVSAEGLNQQVRSSGVGGGTTAVLPDEGGLKIRGTGEQRHLEVAMPAGDLWPKVASFWSKSGATMKRSEPAVGVMETNWIEYQEQLPQTGVGKLFRSILKNVGDSGFRDRYIVRLEKASPQSTRIFLTHRGAELMVTDTGSKWESRPSSQERAAEMLNRLKSYLGSGKTEKVYSSDGSSAAPGEKKKLFGVFNVGEASEDEPVAKRQGSGSSIYVAGNPRNAYASVGSSLSRTGFVIEGKDAAKGLYAAKWTGQEKKKGLLERINIFKKDEASVLAADSKYIIKVSGSGSGAAVTVLDEKGQLKTDAQAQAVLEVLRKDLSR